MTSANLNSGLDELVTATDRPGGGGEALSQRLSLIPAQGTPIGDRFYALTIVTDENYPHVPPRVKFSQRVAISCVDGSGNVNVASIPGFQWRYEKSMMDVLVALRQHMSSSSVSRACAAVQGDY